MTNVTLGEVVPPAKVQVLPLELSAKRIHLGVMVGAENNQVIPPVQSLVAASERLDVVCLRVCNA